jgi:hypothetical protein
VRVRVPLWAQKPIKTVVLIGFFCFSFLESQDKISYPFTSPKTRNKDKSPPLSTLIPTLKKLSIYVAITSNQKSITPALHSHSHSEKAIHLRRHNFHQKSITPALHSHSHSEKAIHLRRQTTQALQSPAYPAFFEAKPDHSAMQPIRKQARH